MHDVIYTINEDIKLMFKTVASINTNGRTYSNCSEFKLNNNQTCNTMIKRTLSYYLFIDDRRGGKSEKICIYPEHMFTLLSMFEYAKKTWFGIGNNNIYGYLDNSLQVISEDSSYIKLPMDKILRIAPGVFKNELGDKPCLDLYLNNPEPVQISLDTFDGLYYTLSKLDMIGYANTALSFMMLRYEPSNRIDYAVNTNNKIQTATDTSTASGSSGRSFNGSNNKGSLLD
jgi:hypothetical protein